MLRRVLALAAAAIIAAWLVSLALFMNDRDGMARWRAYLNGPKCAAGQHPTYFGCRSDSTAMPGLSAS